MCQYLQAEMDHLAGFVQPGDKILELGCGFGRVLAPLARIAGQGWGVDNSPESVALARAEYPDLDLSVMDAGSLNFDEHKFDLVFGWLQSYYLQPEGVLESGCILWSVG